MSTQLDTKDTQFYFLGACGDENEGRLARHGWR